MVICLCVCIHKRLIWSILWEILGYKRNSKRKLFYEISRTEYQWLLTQTASGFDFLTQCSPKEIKCELQISPYVILNFWATMLKKCKEK